MPQNPRYEQQFLDVLKSIFIGVKVEGESGYINLMKIKATYFERGVFPQLMQDIDAACKPFEKSFREELFDKLYDFFRRYFSESGSIYFRHTAASACTSNTWPRTTSCRSSFRTRIKLTTSTT